MGQTVLAISYLVIGFLAAIGLLVSMKVAFTFLSRLLSKESDRDKRGD